MQRGGLVIVYVSAKLNYLDLLVDKVHLRFVIFFCSKATVLVNLMWISLLFPRVTKASENLQVYLSVHLPSTYIVISCLCRAVAGRLYYDIPNFNNCLVKNLHLKHTCDSFQHTSKYYALTIIHSIKNNCLICTTPVIGNILEDLRYTNY